MDYLKSIDIFPKAIDDFRVKTLSGSVVSIVSVIIMIALFFSELALYNKTVIM